MKKQSLGQYLSAGLPTSRFNGTPIYVYAFVSPSDVVVYVGRSYDPRTRIGAHRATAAWWTPDLEWSVIDIAHSWDEAKSLEERAIRDLQPIANIVHNNGKGVAA